MNMGTITEWSSTVAVHICTLTLVCDLYFFHYVTCTHIIIGVDIATDTDHVFVFLYVKVH